MWHKNQLFELLEMVEEDPFFKGKVKLIQDTPLQKDDKHFEALLSTIKDLAALIS